jgi:SpoVK/Ycf46/Vps4 family AAA+-type ATPase
VKEKLRESIVYPLTNIDLAKKYGMMTGGGVLLYGPPGCGKTFIGKASAGECNAAFISVKMSDIVDMYAGNTEKNIHNAFETARSHKPCILFFDEMDGIAGKREGMDQSFEKRSINQFLIELDGIEYSNEGVLICGATNAPWDVDAALRRSGRFSKAIYCPPPDKVTRLSIIKLNLKKRPVDPKLPVGRIARMTDGFASADVKALCDAAAAIPWKEALKTGKERIIRFKDFVKATKGDEGVKSSLPAWYGSVKKKLIEEEDEDGKGGKSKSTLGTLVGDIFSMAPATPTEGGNEQMTVKHKEPQKGLIPEEERQLFHSLIKEIREKTDPTKKILRKMMVLFARYVA